MSESVVIVDYGSGNLRSAEKAIQRASGETDTPFTVTVSGDADTVRKADRIVLPGVGAFGDCRAGLLAVPGMKEAIQENVREKGNPFLGICVGMQLLAREGHEHGIHAGMGWLDATVGPLSPADTSLKIPHMGWNTLSLTGAGTAHPVTKDLGTEDHVYFVHSYHMHMNSTDALLATTDYGETVTAIVGQDNFIGTQFHPEKSQAVGLRFLQSFLEWRP
ncbi:imidazole glycerol phosphate synthase subunit HisH [Kordiimonas sediminis]|uniref:Imidazole glycerol phosphate synthase subunit HisH n=1 Tax=Kordiimonas sediminis TaxID=1735581 RepID=A0A919E5R8_9PROT|nr:imidazole glycerol phosphate synthase subunit HisH [Kordiimonas sediminis]GHF15201.1 imidazole glycerol phosphate synthase subunit HisH [Kordiimonas sediminis]